MLLNNEHDCTGIAQHSVITIILHFGKLIWICTTSFIFIHMTCSRPTEVGLGEQLNAYCLFQMVNFPALYKFVCYFKCVTALENILFA